jgi:DNA modification methylase
MDYDTFLETKQTYVKSVGPEVTADAIHPLLFPFQRDLTRWAIRKGRTAIFADTGLGKTFMQLEWARLISRQCLIIAPLSVARQTIREAHKIGLSVHYVRTSEDVRPGINITNYERIEAFDPTMFDAVVLDESSILKGLDGKTRKTLTEMFADTPYRLCCTATPAPNDLVEIANHAEFLGIMTIADMKASFFVHDDEGWRLRGYAKEPFFKWLASWSMSVRKPSDLGYDDEGYVLPELRINPIWLTIDFVPQDQLFFTDLAGLKGRLDVRKATIVQKVTHAADLINDNDDQWIVWCGLDEEANQITRLIPGAINVQGGDSAEDKAQKLEAFQDGAYRVLVTKAKIAGFGMNFQNAHNMAFIGLSDSWEAFYQCIRREWRFGQTEPVNVKIILTEQEEPIYRNVMRKEAESAILAQQLIDNVQNYERAEILSAHLADSWTYTEDVQYGKDWTLYLGDSAKRLSEIHADSVGLSVFSPPFLSLYTYSPTERDLGNSRTPAEFFQHFGYIIDELLRVTMPGRLCAVHAADVPAMLSRDGYIGMKDFPGEVINAFETHGWVWSGRAVIRKNPQAQAIRTHAKALLFAQLRKDAAWTRPAILDQILVFMKPGENAIPILPKISNDEWIDWASGIWDGISESDTLQYTTVRTAQDDRHICPLQLSTIERCVRLWSNTGEIVLSPFAGIGSEGYTALRLERKFIGVELKPEYWRQAARNLHDISMRSQSLLDLVPADDEVV